MKTNSLILLSALASALVGSAGCGQSNKNAEPAPTAAAVQPVDDTRTLTITANDSMKFNLSEIQAKPGEKLRVTLSNIGQTPKQAMGHNWVLLKPMADAEVNTFAIACATKAPNYLPDDKSAVLVSTKILGPRETDTVEFAAPTTPGEYPFLCTFPGHFAMMKGKLVVK